MPCDFFDDVNGQSFAVVFLEDFPQVYSENLEDHAEVIAVRTLVEEGIQQIKDVAIVPVEFLLPFFVILEGLYPLRI